MALRVADNSKLMLQRPKSKHYCSRTQPTLKHKPKMHSLSSNKTCSRLRRGEVPSLPNNNLSHHGNESPRMSSISQSRIHKQMIRSGKEHLSTSISFRTRLLEQLTKWSVSFKSIRTSATQLSSLSRRVYANFKHKRRRKRLDRPVRAKFKLKRSSRKKKR